MRSCLACVLVGFLVVASGEAAARAGDAKPVSKGKAKAKPKASKAKPKAKAKAKPKAVKGTLWVSTKRPKPGDPVLVKVTGVANAPRGFGGKRRLQFFPVRGGWQAVFAVPMDGAPELMDQDRGWWSWWHGAGTEESGGKVAKATTIKVSIVGGLRETLVVRDHTFKEEAITMDEARAEPAANQVKEVDADNAAVIAALRNTDPPLFRGRFRAPAPGRRTSPFGAWRTFNQSEHRSRHLGMDIAARKGAPVRAVERGKVALVRAGVLMGGTVVVVHGAGLASAYFHVSDFSVKAGETVERGAVLGKVGLTGRTNGPHVHVGIWAPGGFVDPAAFFKLRIGTPVEAAGPAVAGATAKRKSGGKK